jgi:hypothetical protein
MYRVLLLACGLVFLGYFVWFNAVILIHAVLLLALCALLAATVVAGPLLAWRYRYALHIVRAVPPPPPPAPVVPPLWGGHPETCPCGGSGRVPCPFTTTPEEVRP